MYPKGGHPPTHNPSSCFVLKAAFIFFELSLEYISLITDLNGAISLLDSSYKVSIPSRIEINLTLCKGNHFSTYSPVLI